MQKLPKLLVVIIFCLFNLTSNLFAKETLTIAKIQNMHLSNISEIVLNEAYSKLGIVVKFKEYPIKRSLAESNMGRVDGELHRVKGIDKKFTNLIRVSIPVNNDEWVVLTKDKDFVVDGWESLKPYSIGIKRGVLIIENKTKGMNVHPVSKFEQAFKMVNDNRLDICIVGRTNALFTIKKLKLEGLKMLNPPVDTGPLYHYLHKKHKELVPKITQVLSQMHEEGRIKQIKEEYISKALSSF